MKILVSGSNGLLGSVVRLHLSAQGHQVIRLVRKPPGDGEVRWDPNNGLIDAEGLEGLDAAVHMASLPQSRWTSAYLQRMRTSRIRANYMIAEALAQRRHKPKVLVCASGQGVYAPSGDEVLTEDSPMGTDFLAQMMCEAEAATEPASAAGIRVVHLRIPTVVGGPNLATFAARSGVRPMGSGQQWTSWVARDEMASIVQHAIETVELAGPVNAASPHPLRNVEMAAAFGRVLGRRPGQPVPALLLRLLLGEMANALVLASRRIEPRRLLATGYAFRFADLEAAIRHEIGQHEVE